MQLESEFKNMESNIAIFSFIKENATIELELESPNFSEFVKKIILNNYEVTEENITVDLKKTEDKVDINELKSIVIEIHQKYFDELSKFYENIKKDINTYYSDEQELIKCIQEYIESAENEETNNTDDSSSSESCNTKL